MHIGQKFGGTHIDNVLRQYFHEQPEELVSIPNEDYIPSSFPEIDDNSPGLYSKNVYNDNNYRHPVHTHTRPNIKELSAVALPSAAILPYPTYYFYLSRFIQPSEARQGSNEKNITDLVKVDDSPFAHYRLPWPFVLFNRRVRDLFINANGAIHMSKSQPCRRDNFFLFERYGCTLNTTYEGIVAAYLTDLTFNNCPSPAQVVTYNSKNTATIAYRSVCYYNTKIDNTFRITFDRRDHHIEVAYDRIRKNFLFPFRDYTVVGLRGFLNDTIMSTSLVTTKEDDERGKLVWRTRVPGIYPKFEEVATGKKIIYCPVTLEWCLHNSTLSIDFASSNESSLVMLTLSTLVLSCKSYVDYFMVASLLNVTYENVSNSIQHSADFLTYFPCQTNQSMVIDNTASDISTHHVINCQLNVTTLSNFLSRNFSNIADLYLFPAYVSNNSTVTTSIRVLPMVSMKMSVVNGSNEQFIISDDNESNITGTCQHSALCFGNFTCLNADCYRKGDPESIYEIRSCANECPNDVYSLSFASTQVFDDDGKCCTIADLDCAGFCFGNSTVTLNDEGSRYCCGGDKYVDCQGICEGKTEFDACGICGGSDTTGITCYNFNLLTMATNYEDNSSLYPSFNIPSHFDAAIDNEYLEMQSVESIILENHLNTNFEIFLTVPDDDSSVAPVLNFSFSKSLLVANSSIIITLQVSLAAMLNGMQNNWMVKHVRVNYYRVDYPRANFYRTIPIYPTVYGCSVLNRGRCMVLPGCIFCQTFPKMMLVNNHVHRYLLYPDDEDEVWNTSSQSFHRRLFNNFIPTRYRSSMKVVNGVCVDGWLTEDCSVNKNVNQILANGAQRNQINMISCVVMITLSIMSIMEI